ncbi:MAG: hypothetical protein VKN33_06735 [Candidatus Sericytochromatia bacterium]|nr:hypothetical protein [Candidatus Sericytochromatia bacterium]
MLGLMTFLMFFTTLFQAWQAHKQWQAYQRGEVTRGRAVNQITNVVLMAAGTVGLFLVGRLIG